MSMDRLQKKCLVGSTLMHLFLALLFLLGSAFFVHPEKRLAQPHVRVVPSILIDQALAGGGGSPKVAPSEDQQKGETLVPQPKPPVQEPKPEPPAPKPQPQVEPPAPKPEIKAKPAVPKAKPAPTSKAFEPLELKPATRNPAEKRKAQMEAEGKQRAEIAQKLASKLGTTEKSLRAGFKEGTKVEVSGPGGEAYAGYDAWVKAVYNDAWQISHSFSDEDATTQVSVTIARSGHVISARIVRRSGVSLLDKSVQRALDSVKFVAPFPAGSLDQQRTFTINFNLKAKRLLG